MARPHGYEYGLASRRAFGHRDADARAHAKGSAREPEVVPRSCHWAAATYVGARRRSRSGRDKKDRGTRVGTVMLGMLGR